MHCEQNVHTNELFILYCRLTKKYVCVEHSTYKTYMTSPIIDWLFLHGIYVMASGQQGGQMFTDNMRKATFCKFYVCVTFGNVYN